jgi:biopolymer transport protein TolR
MFEYSRRSRKKLMGEINVVPYIDVMLVLLIIFMVTTPLLTAGVDIDLPQADAETVDLKDQEPFVVSVDRNGALYYEDQPVSNDEVVQKAAAVMRRNPATPFLVRGDRRVEYQAVMNAMVLLQQAGIPKVGLITEPPEDTQ